MALDLANGYSRKDGSSASNIYYAYSLNPNATDDDKEFSIRKVSLVGGVETVTWTNGSPTFFASDWTNRSSSFATPSGSLGITYSQNVIASGTTVNHRYVEFSWSLLPGADQYEVTSMSSQGILQKDGTRLLGQYVDRSYSENLINLTNYVQSYLNPGTYTFTVTTKNVAGYISSTVTINFPI